MKGVFTGDTWTAATTWVRNTLLNLIVLLSTLAGLLLTPHVPVALLNTVTDHLKRRGHGWEELITAVALLFQAIIISTVIYNLKLFETSRTRQDQPLPRFRKFVLMLVRRLKSLRKRGARSPEELNPTPGFGDGLRDVRKYIIVPSLFSAWLCGSRLWAISREGAVNPVHLWGIGAMVGSASHFW